MITPLFGATRFTVSQKNQPRLAKALEDILDTYKQTVKEASEIPVVWTSDGDTVTLTLNPDSSKAYQIFEKALAALLKKKLGEMGVNMGASKAQTA